MRKIVTLLLGLLMVFSLAACGAGGGSSSVNSAYKQEIANSAKKLNDTYTNYIISTTTEGFGNQQEYIEVIKGNDIYTEYSVDEYGDIGTIPYGSGESIPYALVDWTHDGQYYSLGYADDGEVMYKFPENFATKYDYDREMLYVNRLLAGATEIKPYEDLHLTLAGETSTFKAYSISVDAKTVMEIMSADSRGVYMSIKDSEKSGSNISKLCDFYLEDSRLMNTYSDGRVIVAIDSDGILKFMSLEIGGLGARMYVTKAVVDVRNQNVRDTPDFSGAVPVVSTMTELADFVAQYPDYESALSALHDKYDSEYADFDAEPSIGLPEEGDLDDSQETDAVQEPADPDASQEPIDPDAAVGQPVE